MSNAAIDSPPTDTASAPAVADASRENAARVAAESPSVRQYGLINWVGLWTLTEKEIQRFLKVGVQTVFAPMVTTLLFFAIFALALGGIVRETGGTPFLTFLAPGLVVMSMLQNAFANTSSSVTISKVQGNIVDVLMPPLSHLELALAYALGGIVRGLMVGGATLLAIAAMDLVLTDIQVLRPVSASGLFFIVFHAIFGSMLLSLLGLAAGIWSEKFDHIAAVTNFLVTPLTFLSGTFYTIDRLPEDFQFIAHFNPFFYVIDGFRYGFIGLSDPTFAHSLPVGVAVVLAANLLLWLLCVRMLATGYKLKA